MALRLRRLKILRFRDVRPDTELRFNDTWNVVLGHNATGKTTLLNLISMALRGDFTELANESFSLEYELGDDRSNLRVSLQNDVVERSTVGGVTDPVLRMERRDASGYRATLSALSTTRDGTTRFGTPPLPMEEGIRTFSTEPRYALLPIAVMVHPVSESLFSAAIWLYEAVSVYRFDEALEVFRIVLGGSSDAPALPQHAEAKAWMNDGFLFFSPLLNPKAATWTPIRAEGDPTSIQGAFEACPNLRRAVSQLGGSSLHAVYPITDSTVLEKVTEAALGAPTITLRRPDGSTVSVRHLSFGQKRLFTFAWYLDSNPGPVVADELVNGMHYEWIDECVRAMEGRQKFITAQNPLILDHVDIASADDVARSFVLCRADHNAEGKREVVWANPSAEQSAEFFRAYENGVLKVHEILRTEGLW